MNVNELPSTGRTLGLLVRSVVSADPARAVASAVMAVFAECWPVLVAVGISQVVDAAATGRGISRAAAAIALAVLLRLIASPPLATVSYSLQERAAARIERRIIELTCALPGIDHLEQPELLDRIALLQRSSASIGYAVNNLLGAFATVVQVGVTALLLLSVDSLAAFLVVAALVPFAAGVVKNRLRAQLDVESGHHWRAKKGLRILAWAPDSGPDLRLAGAGATVRARQDAAVRGLRQAHDQWAIKAGAAQALGDTAFGIALVAVVVLVAGRVRRGEATAGDLVMALILGQRLAGQMGLAISRVTNLLQLVRSLRVLAWLEDAAGVSNAARAPRPLMAPPARLRQGIEFRDVHFAYPNNGRPVLQGIDLELRPGTTVALVGENGAGKSTLVSLLCGFHEPTAGAIAVDGVPLRDIDPRAWQQRLTAAFQEAARYEVEVVAAVGIGDLRTQDGDEVALPPVDRVASAVTQAGLDDVVRRFPAGLSTRLGRRFPGGREISGGQWQKVGHARSALRADPLMLVLDEPTAALDAQAEHDLFQRIRHRPGAGREITLFVSHRFSTVRDADHIVVLDGGRITEQGDHEALVALGGTYADLYERQARQYR